MSDLSLFALRASEGFGRRVARRLGIELARLEERDFDDGEHSCRLLEPVRGHDVYLLQSLFGEPGQSVHDKLCRLLFLIGTLRAAGAARVTVLVPYLCYARMDQQNRAGDPVAIAQLARWFEAAGAECVVTLDVHNLAAFQNAFRCRTVHLEARDLLIEHLAPRLRGREVTVMSPDLGGAKRAERFRRALSEALGREVALGFVEKYREQLALAGSTVVGDLAGRTVLIVDDMISSGATMARAAAACRRLGATTICAVASHGLFVDDAARRLSECGIDHLAVSDSVPPLRLQDGPLTDRLAVLDASGLFADAVRALHGGAAGC